MYKIKVEYFKDTEMSEYLYIKGMLTCIACDENFTYHNNLIFIDPMEELEIDCYECKRSKIYTTGHFPNNTYGLKEINADLNRMLEQALKVITFRRSSEKQNTLNVTAYEREY